MAKREKKIIISGVTKEQVEGAMADYASADAQINKINAKLEADITRLRDSVSSRVAELMERKSQAFDLINHYAIENRDNLFKGRKSIETVHGVYGFRTGTPRLKLHKGFTWAKVVNLVKAFAPDYVRVTEEVAKDKLLADRGIDLMVELMPEIGVDVVQDETFYIDLKKEEING